MTRIVAGAAGSLTLQVPKRGTRPTSDRVREAIFSALDARDLVREARVLDLYAGSGALGLEAASRGAVHIDLVERGAEAAQVCRRNATVVRKALAGDIPIDVHAKSVQGFLDGAPAGNWDIVFIDPPYDVGEDELAAVLASLAPLLAPGASVVVERSARTPQPTLPAALEVERRKDYGETTLWWVGPVEE
ncbi:16S rRNA (guanine(966)-N(2))-methyltransferase RsmD [Leifsonia sp. ALI-44-B]|uniref:RsmD family RNA methyltransferase n=1 Tax=Leifsonia sp. ALI-44-B TaxID=1933776 RepID=UPI00097CB28E|nr:RsmD family RNA methyltransferase [Leifsonia sp. ALI-44-B]ONI63844.1 16S rRNA (guanine(966)-N(2))-methyltransferase RsmD [Leifsonia sp. ALI-44-B]